MSILELKSNTIKVLQVSEGYVADNGDYIEGESRWGCDHRCDAVPSGTANEIDLGDGFVKKFSFVCYLSPNCREFIIGEKVLLERYGREYHLEVVDFKRYQYQAKVWVG